MSIICAISPCLYPSTSWSTNTARAPAGSSFIAASRSNPASGPAVFTSGAFSNGVRSSVANTRAVRRIRERRSERAVFTAMG